MLAHIKKFLIIIAFVFVGTAAYAASDAEIKAALAPLVETTAADFGINTAEAETYVLISYRALEASKAIDALAAQRSEALQETAESYLLSVLAIREMKALMPLLTAGTPGADIPADLVDRINGVAQLASQAIVTSFSAASKRSIYVVDQLAASNSCEAASDTCLDEMEEALNLVSSNSEIMRSLMEQGDTFFNLAAAKQMTY